MSEKRRIDKKCWKGKKIGNPKTKVINGVRVNNCVPEANEQVDEAEHQGKDVTLNKPTRDSEGGKKFKVYVKDGDKVKKVRFGDPNMEIKRDNPEARKSFRARHKCDQKKDKTKPGYWSCKMWGKKSVSDITESFDELIQITLDNLNSRY